MSLTTTFKQLHRQAQNNKWMRYFTVFVRIALAWGFIPSGMQKVLGHRFTTLSDNHPMGNYLDALFNTGYYHNFIGIMQVIAAILLLIPRTALLGAVIYFPIILNICILSLSVRFDGSLVSSPLMVLAVTYLLCWDYDRLTHIFTPGNRFDALDKKFPFRFFTAVVVIIIFTAVLLRNVFEIRPHNHMKDCVQQCGETNNPDACKEFCNCIHQEGKPLNTCLLQYKQAN